MVVQNVNVKTGNPIIEITFRKLASNCSVLITSGRLLKAPLPREYHIFIVSLGIPVRQNIILSGPHRCTRSSPQVFSSDSLSTSLTCSVTLTLLPSSPSSDPSDSSSLIGLPKPSFHRNSLYAGKHNKVSKMYVPVKYAVNKKAL